ncbi:hypothetical protein [Methylovorus sp. MM2]|uniref:hypothetical protein n=1 Tax=Methylovorus sp. MM2 TaxID=1848038 RepID=UPI000B496B1D|nr:hypothetical protein [Methylovorus sp. MM2]
MLKRIYINHAATSHYAHPLSYFLLFAGAFSVIALLITLEHISQRNTALEKDALQLKQPSISAQQSTKDQNSGKRDEIAAVKTVMAELALPWQVLFKTLESISTPEVKLISVEPNARQRKLRITAEATDTHVMLEYISSLEKQAALKDVFLLTHEHTKEGPMPIRFLVEAVWRI